jgi:hypothetical protein
MLNGHQQDNWSGCRLVTMDHPFEHALCDFCAQVVKHKPYNHIALPLYIFFARKKNRERHQKIVFPKGED